MGKVSEADFGVIVPNAELRPYAAPGQVLDFAADRPLQDGDVGLFALGNSTLIRQYCEDSAGYVHLLCVNRRLRRRDITCRPEEVCCLGRALLPEIPLP
ncbi:MAG: hypothetical protein II794_01505 [Oscillospiraceae bacterium]|nr:hypothetical protein [Oscillospiraceae bacterium]